MTALFDVEKCSMLLKLALNRIRLQKNKKRELNEVRRREIATLLADGKEDQARVKVIALVHEDLMVEALGIVEVYCETIGVRLDIIAAQISCPLDMHEAITGIIYSAPYFEHSPELAKIARMLMHKYGADFAHEAATNKLINARLFRALSNQLPEDGLIHFYLSVISRNFEIDWTVPTVEGMAKIDEALAKKGLREESSAPLYNAMDEGPVLSGIFQQDAVESTWGWVTTEELGPQRPVLVTRGESVPWPKSRDSVRVQLTDPVKSGTITGELLSDGPAPKSVARHVSGVLQVDKKGNHWAVTRDPISSRALYVFIAAKDLNGAQLNDHVRVELHNRADSKLSGRVTAHTAAEQLPNLEQTQPRFYQGDLQRDKSGRYWVTQATPVIPGPARAELSLTRPVYIADKDLLPGLTSGTRVIIELHARTDDKLSARIVSAVNSVSNTASEGNEFDAVLTLDSHTGMGYAVHPSTRAVYVMPTSEHLNYAQHLDHVHVAPLDQSSVNQGQFTLGHVTRVIKPASHTKDVIGQVTVAVDGTAHVPYLTSIHRLRVDDTADQITVDISPDAVKKHYLRTGDLVMVRAQRYFPTNDSSSPHVTGEVMHVLQQSSDLSLTGVKSSVTPSPSASFVSTNDSEVNDHVLFQGLESELDNSIYHVTDELRSRGAEASHVITDEPVMVLDIGEYSVRAGLHTLVNEGQTSPSLELSAVIGRASVPPTMLTAVNDEFYFGYEALRRRSVLSVNSLLEHGHVLDWNHVDQFVGHVYEQLQMISAEYPVVLPLPANTPHANISEYASVLFESHVVPYLALPSQVTCLPWSVARDSPALLVDIGAGQTQVTAVTADNRVLHHVTARTILGGRSLATVLSRDLKLDHVPWVITTQLLNHCALVEDVTQLDHVIDRSEPVSLSDLEVEAGLPAIFGAERYRCPELLFDPRPLGLERDQGLSHVLARSLNRVTDQTLRQQLARNIVLSGGVSQLTGLTARLTRELRALMSDHVINVQSAASASHVVWLGAARSVQQQRYYSRDDFFEQGSRVFIDSAQL